MIIKIEKDIKKRIAMKKMDEISEPLYMRLRQTGAQPARLYGLAKVHKQGTPRRPVLSLPVSSYDNLNNTLAKYFDEIDGANIVPVGHIWKFDLEQHEKRNYGAK